MAALELADRVVPEEKIGGNIHDPGRAELQRCHALAPEHASDDVACRVAWAENRRLFFGITDEGRD